MFGLGFAEILIIVIIAILFLGPDKLPGALVDVAKFFKSIKKSIGTVKDSLEQEMNIADIREEALAYKRELIKARESLDRATNMHKIAADINSATDDILSDVPTPSAAKDIHKEEQITFEKKITKETPNV